MKRGKKLPTIDQQPTPLLKHSAKHQQVVDYYRNMAL
jgi:hypothetical protein